MTFAEEPLFAAVLDDPEDTARQAVYADWLEEQGDPRGDYLRLLLRFDTLEKGDPLIADIAAEKRRLRPALDRHWVAIVDDFDCRVRETRTIRLRLDTYGSAPKKYKGATKVGMVERALLVRNGWEHVGDGNSYSYVRPPEGVEAKAPVIPVEVPTDAEIERMASGFHSKGETAIQVYGPWIVRYQVADSVRYSMRLVTGPGEGQPWEDVRGPAQFEFGIGGPWGATLTWEAENDAPSWSRSTSREVT